MGEFQTRPNLTFDPDMTFGLTQYNRSCELIFIPILTKVNFLRPIF